MTSDPVAALQALSNTRQSIANGDRRATRRWAERAVALNPQLEEGWLILAAIASPRASVVYLEKALRINPDSERVHQGLEWAVRRLEKETQSAVTRPHKAVSKPTVQESTQPVRRAQGKTQNTPEAETKPSKTVTKDLPEGSTRPTLRLRRSASVNGSTPSMPLPPKAMAKFRWPLATISLVIVCLVAAVALWPGNASTALAFLRRSEHVPAAGAPAGVGKPTYTPTFTPSSTPTATYTPTPTFTATYTPSNTPLPTNTPRPTNTSHPSSTAYQPATQVSYPPGSGSNGTKWIDVDLSDQMLYAYEGNTIVGSFLVSTGVAAYPTVVGQFHTYVKLESTLMTGPGYYLPDVPYTMYFFRGYGIHGTYWHSNFGTPMSHGCVNMYTPDAQWLFYWAPLGILVNVHY